MAKFYFTYDPVEFHFTGYSILEEAPENSTVVPVPLCDGERFAKWEEDKWVVKHIVNGEWVNCSDNIPVFQIPEGEIELPRIKTTEEMEVEAAAFAAWQEEQAALEANQGE